MVFDIKSNRYNILFLMVIISFIIRLLFRSHYLDDWDSVQFALAIKDYSILAHQPHPPGYPVYIFLGRIVDIFFNNPTQSLTFMSTLFGSLSLIPIYLISKELFNEKIGLMSSLILSLTPAHLLFSEVAMTDIVSIFFITLTMYLLYLGFESTKYLYIASFMLGLTAGIRATDIILISILLIVLTYRFIFRKREFWPIFMSILLTMLGISIWLVPIVFDTGGLDTFIKVEKSQWDFNDRVNTFSKGGYVLALGLMFNLLFNGWTSTAFLFFILMTLTFIIIKINSEFMINFIDKRFIFLTSWFMIFFWFSIFCHDLYTVRYILPLFPVLSIIFSYSIFGVIYSVKKKIIKILLVIILMVSIIVMANQAIAGAYAISTTIPAPIKAAEFIKDNYDSNNTIIISTGSSRHIRYYLSNYTLYFGHISDKINDYILENKTIISEGSPVTFVSTKAYIFERKKIYPQYEVITLYENKDLQKQFIMLEKDGWYGQEIWGGKAVRWIGNGAILRLYSDDNLTVVINFEIISFYRNRTLEIYNESSRIDQISVTTKFNDIAIPINLHKGVNIISFRVSEGCERPIDYPELRNKDAICLSVAFRQTD